MQCAPLCIKFSFLTSFKTFLSEYRPLMLLINILPNPHGPYLDTLDYLIPPVRKKIDNDELREEHDFTGEVQRLKLLSTKLASYKTQFFKSVKTDVDSFSGLKRRASKILDDQLTVSNYKKKTAKNIFTTNSKDHKFPISSSNVIKITVVPITKESSKIVLKRKQIEKKIHETVSNSNTSIKTNILTLTRHRQPNRDIRETSSAELFKPRWEKSTKVDEITLNRITYAKTIINSLNMNHKGKQVRGNQELRERQVSPKSTRKSYQAITEGCICNETKINNVLDDMTARKNRLTIVGRLGIGENDQYVLNCAATVNNKPIENYISQKVSSASIDEFADRGVNKTTKATQADINVCFSNNKAKNTNENYKKVQCHCKDAATTISEHKLRQSIEHKSPLIVISVYPTKDTTESIKDLSDLIQINQLPEPQQNDKNRVMNFKTMEQTEESTADKKSTARIPEKRSTSPPLKSSKKVEDQTPRIRTPFPPIKNNKVENRILRSRSRSPPVKITSTENSTNKLKKNTSQKSIRNTNRQNRQPKVNKVLPQNDIPNRNPVIVNAALTSKINPPKSSYRGIQETSSKKNKIKKAIVDSFTQRVLMTEKGKDGFRRVKAIPARNASSVTINIDGENERYRVLFLQDKLNTDLNIRKTLKTHQQNLLNDLKNKNRISDEYFTENYMIPKKDVPGKKLDRLSKQLINSQGLSKRTPGLKIRDSLEMCNRRENSEDDQNKKNSYKNYEPTIKIMHKTVNKAKDEDVSAPVKHYRGDQCCVPSPTLRDQEIRDLLGIKRPRSGKSEFVQEVLPELIGQNLHYTLHPEKCIRSNSSVSVQCNNNSLNKIGNKINISDQPKFVNTWTQCEESIINSNKQMVLNRNIQVFLQVEQFTKQKPIMLSRKQYEKVKKTIKKKISKKFSQERRKLNNSTKCSLVSIGEIRKTRKHQTSNVKICRTVQVENNPNFKHEDDCKNNNHEEHKPLLPLKTPENTTKDDVTHLNILNTSPRQVVSSMEIRYASLAHLRHVTFSSSNIKSKSGSPLCLKQKNCPSIQTIFKGHKKCATPNLGTSAYSLYSDEEIDDSDNKYPSHPYDEKPKKPFLRRLMSCLVMRSNRASEAILPQQYDKPCLVNSFDSYHINTSLAAIELTSSLYDTSASFYSNHTILPITRMKRGFLSSVRGFLTNLKSR